MHYRSGFPAQVPACCAPLAVLLATSLLLLAAASGVSAAEFTRSPLRSAQLLVHSGKWAAVAPRSTMAERQEIRSHFAAVGELLDHNTPASLDLAVARFEDVLQVTLTPATRGELRQRLAARRQIQLERLRQYSLTGSFPLNRHYAGEARPIFVDADGTHCAVGHLMALDGWEPRVMEIARVSPNVLVRDVHSGPLVSWLLTSGLTQDEAALIQPAYLPPAGADATTLSTLIVPGTTLERGGFRYENFSFSATASGGAIAPSAGDFSVIYGWPPTATVPTFCAGYNSPACVPTPDTLWFGYNWVSGASGTLQTRTNQSMALEFQYDVVAQVPGRLISGASTNAGGLYNEPFFAPPNTAFLTTTLEASPGTASLTVDAFYNLQAKALLSDPVDQARVRYTVQLGANAYFGSFYSQLLQPVPLPASGALLLGSLAALVRRARLTSGGGEAGRAGRRS